MQLQLNSVAGALALIASSAALAQAQPVNKPPTPVPSPTAPAPATQPTTATPDEPGMPQSTAPGQTATTPGQEQTSPGQANQLTPSATGQTPSGQSVPNQAPNQAQVNKATAADIKSGVSVYDSKGELVGKIDSVTAKGAVIDTGTVKATIPSSSFAKGDKGLVFGMSKAELEAAAKSETKPPKKPK